MIRGWWRRIGIDALSVEADALIARTEALGAPGEAAVETGQGVVVAVAVLIFGTLPPGAAHERGGQTVDAGVTAAGLALRLAAMVMTGCHGARGE